VRDMMVIRPPTAEEIWVALWDYLEGRDLDDRELWILQGIL